MSESDEDAHLLEDESMDEVHELDDALQESVDSSASPTKSLSRQQRISGSNSDRDSSDSDMSELFAGSSDSEEDADADAPPSHPPRSSRPERALGPTLNGAGDNDDEEEEDDDEPPEIPGSPMRTTTEHSGGRMNRLSDLDISNCGEVTRKRQQSQPVVAILTINHEDGRDHKEEEDEYEIHEAEAPRAMEFHTLSSSSEGSDNEAGGSDDDDDNNNHHSRESEQKWQPQLHQQRPKTAAKDLEPYRDLIPKDYYQQLVQDTATARSMTPEHTIDTKRSQASDTNATTARNVKPSAPTSKSSTKTSTTTTYCFRVPQEIEELFQFVDAFQPETTEIPTRLQPFVPEYVPAIGLPFDGIQIPRPDGRIDDAGVRFVREPGAQSDAAELELLLSAASKNQQRRRHEGTADRVHSIEFASQRPREIDQWIASVAKVQASKPPPTVIYKRPMPTISSLMELWPEPFEEYLAPQPAISISQLDVSLSELIRIVCGVLDIPVHDSNEIQSLHVLFSLYYEATLYEKEMAAR